MRVAFMGSVRLSRAFLERTLELPAARLVGVATRASSPRQSDFACLEPLARRAGVPCFLDRGNDQRGLAAWLRRVEAEVVYCFGWSYLLRAEVLSVPRLGCIGYHPTALPRHRGRHPLIWALVLGLDETASTFFYMDEGVDTGDILSQQTVPIRASDDAGSLYRRMIGVGCEQIAEFTPRLAAGTAPRRPQDHSRATRWRRRTEVDGEIDWRMSAGAIHDLVRGLTRPYAGAHAVFRGRPAKVWATRPVGSAEVPPDAEPGKVLAVEGGRPLVRCGDGGIWLLEHDLAPPPTAGEYL